MIRRLARFGRRFGRDTRGLALLEFAFMLPIFITLCVGGTELAHYITTKQRMSQIALQIADNAARMGTGAALAAKTISEADINDVFAGAQLESGRLDLNANGRVILSDLEPTQNSVTNTTFRIGWQRCYGAKTAHGSSYGVAGATGLAGMGRSGPRFTQTKALMDGASMFVELYYIYKPILPGIEPRFIPAATNGEGVVLLETASMAVRDRRALTMMPLPVSGVTASTC